MALTGWTQPRLQPRFLPTKRNGQAVDLTMPLQSRMSDGHAKRHLQELRVLHLQVRDTTSALATGEVADFLEHLAVLELGCAALRRSLYDVADLAGFSSDFQQATPDLTRQIHDERLELTKSNYRFSALLRRRRRSVELLLRHYQSSSREILSGLEHSPALRRISAEA
jgi:hypothetical protein